MSPNPAGNHCEAYYPDIFIRQDDTSVGRDDRETKDKIYKNLYQAVRWLLIHEFQLGTGDSPATGTFTINADDPKKPGPVKIKVDGNEISVNRGASDAATATSLATAINGQNLPVIAVASDKVVTLYAKTAGAAGDKIKIEATQGATASGDTLTGGVIEPDAVKITLPPQPDSFTDCGSSTDSDAVKQLRLTMLASYGMLLSDNFIDPSMGRPANAQPGPDDIPIDNRTGENPKNGNVSFYIVPQFTQQVTSTVKEFKASTKLFERVLDYLRRLGKSDDNSRITISTRQLAGVTRRLVDERVDPEDPQLRIRIDNALALFLGDKVDGATDSISIDQMPNLDEGTVVDIIAANVSALAAIYFASQLEELKMFAVGERVVEHFLSGMLPISRGPGGRKIYDYFKQAPNRITEVERRNSYARCFGLAQGAAADALPNREFSDLWIRFLSSVSIFNRQFNVTPTGSGGPPNSTVIVSTEVQRVTGEQAVKAARDLAVNLSLHGYGSAHFIAVELRRLVDTVKDMLSSTDVLQAYGVRDLWQLIDRVSGLYLGGAVSSVRYKTTAQAGANIILFLAKNAPQLSSVASINPGTADLFKGADIRANVERWLAVTGTADDAIDKFSGPIDVTQQPTIPPMPSMAALPEAVRNLLGQVNIPNVAGVNIPVPGGAVPRA